MSDKEFWLKSVYSDGSCNFVSNPTPKKGEKISIAVQVFENAPLDGVFLSGKQNGVGFPKKMTHTESKDGLARYELEVQIFETFCFENSAHCRFAGDLLAILVVFV